jgi:hypothetical protein
MHALCLTLLLTLLPAAIPTLPATIEVTHAGSGDLLAEARVYCQERQVAVTGSDGTARDVHCTGPVRVEADGFLTLDEVHLDAPFVRVALEPAPEGLQETVTVSAAGLDTRDVGIPSQFVLQAAELATLRGALLDDPLRAMQALPGVSTSDDLRAEFSVRGSPFRQVGLVLDDVKSRLLMHTVRGVEQTGSVALLNADLVASGALAAGSYPQRYGNSAGAELVVRTRDGNAAQVRGRLLLSAIATTATFDGPLGHERVTWIAGVRRSYASWIVNRIDDDLSGTFDFQDAQGKLSARLGDRQRATLSLLSGASTYDERARRTAAWAIDIGRNTTHLASATWEATLPRDVLVSQRLSFITSNFRNENPAGLDLDRGRERETLYRAAVTWAPSARMSVDASGVVEGFRSDGQVVRFGGTAGPQGEAYPFDARAHRTGGHVHARWTPLGMLRIGAGGRVDTFDGLGTVAVPWAQVDLALSKHVSLLAATGRHRQAPDMLQRALPGPSASLTYERARHDDVGLGWQAGPWSAQVAAYRRLEDEVLDRPGLDARVVDGRIVPGDPLAPWRNVLAGRSRGLEALVRRASTRWSGWASYARARTTHKMPDGLRFSGAFDQRHVASIAGFAQLNARWDASATLRLSSNWPYAGYFEERDGRVVLSPLRNAMRLPVYSRFDLRLRRAVPVPRGRLTLTGEAINLLNRRNLRQAAETVNLATGVVRRVSEKQLPILPSIGVAWEF